MVTRISEWSASVVSHSNLRIATPATAMSSTGRTAERTTGSSFKVGRGTLLRVRFQVRK